MVGIGAAPPSGRLASLIRTARTSVLGRQPSVTESAGAASTSRGPPSAPPITPCACTQRAKTYRARAGSQAT
jgi:hypothetical protein